MKTSEPKNFSEIEISYKSKVKPSERRRITGSADMFKLCKEIYNDATVEHVEQFFIVMVNRRNAVLGWAKISQGGCSGTVVDAKVVFQIALAANAHGILLTHNHPSGECSPSHEDKQLTNKLREGGKMLDISILDHIIYGGDTYYSFSDEGI